MIQVSQTYDDIISGGGHYEWQIVNNGSVIKDALIDGTIKRTLYEQASIGNVLARQLDFQFYKESVTIDPSYPLIPQFRAINESNQSDWYGACEYWIDTNKTSPYTDKAKITAFDSLLKANVTYLKTGTWTATTDWAIVQEIATDIGVTIEASTQAMFTTPVTINEAPSIGENGTTDMQMLSYIAITKGCNVIINDANELQFIPLFAEQGVGHDAVNIGDAVTDFDASPSETVTGVCLWASSNLCYRYPDVTDSAWEALGGRKINADLAIMASAALAQTLYTSLGNKVYYPYSTSRAWVDPKWQLGDKITIKNVASVICNQVLTLDALSASRLDAEGQKEVNSSYPYLTPTQREIAQSEARTQASITILDDRIDSTVETIDGVQTQVTQNSEGIEAVAERLDGQESYIRWDGSTSTLSIGASDAPTEAQITPNGFAVVQNGEAILEAKDRKVQAKYFVATNLVEVGRYQWVDEGSDGFSLLYMGG